MPIDDRLRTDLPAALDDVRPDLEESLMSTMQRVQRRRRLRLSTYAVGAAAAAVAAFAVVIGTDDASRSVDPVEPVDTTVRVMDDGEGSAEDPAPLAAGRWAIPFIGASDDAPWAEIEVPEGWEHDRLHPVVGTDLDPNLRAIALLTIGRVNPNPCIAYGTQIGPTVADAVSALRSQEVVRSGRPRPVAIDGFTGQVVRFEVPTSEDLNCRRPELVPFNAVGGANATVFPGWTYRVFVLDVDGERLAIVAVHGPEVTPAELAELTGMVTSLRFIDPVPEDE